MELAELARNWNAFAHADPLWAILTAPDKRGNRWQPDEFFATGIAEVATVLAELRAHGSVVEFGSALDFGCGVGRLSQALAAHFESVVGVDISDEMIRRATAFNRHEGRCRYVVNTTSDLSQFDSATFDFIYSNIVLQHMRPEFARGYVAEFVRLLRPRGLAVFQLPARRTTPPASSAKKSAARDGEEPRMEMWGTPPDVVAQWIATAGGTVLQTLSDAGAGTEWVSHRYCVSPRTSS